MKRNGFTLIELMISIAILGIFAAIVIPAIIGSSSSGNQTVSRSYGLAGYVEQRCINGLLFTVTTRNTIQVYDQFGHGVVCKQQ